MDAAPDRSKYKSRKRFWICKRAPTILRGICALNRDGADGLIVLYDTKSDKRLSGTRYRADWLKLPA